MKGNPREGIFYVCQNGKIAHHFTETNSDSESKVNILSGFASAELLEIYDTNLDVDLFANKKPIDQYTQHVI